MFGNEVIFFLATVYELDGVGVLSSCDWFLSLIISYEWFIVINIIDFTLRVFEMISLIKSSPYWGQEIRTCEEEKLWNVNHVEELGTISNIKPHPVSVGSRSDSLKSQEFKIV